MISTTLKEYNEKYKTNLVSYLKEYEDNTKAFFLQKEKEKYHSYHNALMKIANELEFCSKEEVTLDYFDIDTASDLKKINPKAFNKIIKVLSREVEDEEQEKFLLVFSRSKQDTIQVDHLTLENHIKSCKLILKFISEEYEIAFNTKTILNFPSAVDEELEPIDRNLWNWLQNYESTHQYIPIPLAIEGKSKKVVDHYKNYEERNLKYQLEICSIILKKVPQEKIILEYKKEFEKRVLDLRKEYPLPDWDMDKIQKKLFKAFNKLEQFMAGTTFEYKSFHFNDTITLLLHEYFKDGRLDYDKHGIQEDYFALIAQIYYDYEKANFMNTSAYDNPDFNKDCNELGYITRHRIQEFGLECDLDNKNSRFSITDLVNFRSPEPLYINFMNNPENNCKNNSEIYFEQDIKTFLQIFTGTMGFRFFEELYSEFKDSNSILADFSFIYRMMIKENYIAAYIKPEMFRTWLSQEPFCLVLDNKLKTLDRCTTALKQTAYNSIKNKLKNN